MHKMTGKAVLLLLLFSALAICCSCMQGDDTGKAPNKNFTMTDNPEIPLPEDPAVVENEAETMNDSLRCDINDIDYYGKSYFIYHVNALGDELIYAPTGTYTKPKGYPRWQYRIFLDMENNVFLSTRSWMEEGKEPNGDGINCDKAKAPENFDQFISTHRRLLRGDFNESFVFDD